MLRALEMAGFKSFADKTRLEFPQGITVVIGPNGSGKSNVVDAIRWVLGEQSVKSLRGKEMADVIFNGSASRKPVNAAEATLTFDNGQRRLAIDTPEVHITRRVYRSGEGEYLINRQPCRLRDIHDLFAGTGMATEAYSVIEQGKVDVLLQSSPRERRLIFEEAAGISRFKAKKLECQRRLERVEQNLLRLRDIVEEVENRLRSVRMQAGKAQRYQQYADRLQELRTQVCRADWRRLTEQLAALEHELQTAREEVSAATSSADSLDGRAMALEAELTEAGAAIHDLEARVGQSRQRFAAVDADIEHERRRVQEQSEAIGRLRRQSTAMMTRSGDLVQQLSSLEREAVAADARRAEAVRRLGDSERELSVATAQADQLQSEIEQQRTAHLELIRQLAAVASETQSWESSDTAARKALERGSQRRNELTLAQAAAAAQAAELERRAASAAQATRDAATILAALQTDWAHAQRQAQASQERLTDVRHRQLAASERAAVIEELESRLDGVSAGVREVLAQARQGTTSPYAAVRGLVADLFQVRLDSAPLIELALGEAAQFLVVAKSRELLDHLRRKGPSPPGRVHFARLDAPAAPLADGGDLRGQPGVLGRADEYVEVPPEYAVLAQRLLGRTWLVADLDRAIALQESVGRGQKFVTLGGELLHADGTLSVGSKTSATGLISRRSELRSLKQQLVELNQLAEKVRAEHAAAEQQATQLKTQVAAAAARDHDLAAEHAEAKFQHRAAAERLEQLGQHLAATEAELAACVLQQQSAAAALQSARRRREEFERQVAEIEARAADRQAHYRQIEQRRQQLAREASAARIDAARLEQLVAGLAAQRVHLERVQVDGDRAVSDSQTQLELAIERVRAAERAILAGESELALLYLTRESLAAEIQHLAAMRDYGETERQRARHEGQRVRGRLRKLETRLHARELAAGEVRHERTALETRIRDDYGIEIHATASIDEALAPDRRGEVEAEIADLRQKLNNLGNVNLDALGELEELESRFGNLSTQFQDLTSAKESLEQIIHKINADSRRLFADTLEVVKGHFQTLFRKLFGGGQADIVLDEGVDILESGIEIVARPPGKEPRSISLLSGGEKTLTCVALLLAIFRSRPSPFCVLDEVDAALDEANIERFVAVLKEFLEWTQFIVVTHSKKTMTCANTIYGVTMQESGISKRVSVRFEDVSETGEIITFREVEPPPSAAADPPGGASAADTEAA